MPGPAPEERTGLLHLLLHTIPGRLIVIGAAIRAALLVAGAVAALPPFVKVVDTVAGLAIAIGTACFLFRLFVAVKRRLLWRVRRKLTLSYIFVGFIPAILIVAFFLLGGFLLFNNLGSYLVQGRLRGLSEDARFLAQSTALEIQRTGAGDAAAILARRQTNAAAQFKGISLAMLPVGGGCADDAGDVVSRRDLTLPGRDSRQPAARQVPAGRGQPSTREPSAHEPLPRAGPWAHVDPPSAIPAWIGCSGFGGLLAYSHPTANGGEESHVFVRGVAFPDSRRPAFAVVVDLLVTDDLMRKIREDTGVQIGGRMSPTSGRGGPRLIAGRADADGLMTSPDQPAATAPLSWVSMIVYRDWTTGSSEELSAPVQLSIGEIYDRISGLKGPLGNQTVGQALIIVLGVIGFLFLVIECLALVAGLSLAKSITGSIHELFGGTERVRQGDFTHRIPVKSDDQLGELTQSFNSMTASIEDLLRQSAEKKRLEEELRIAHEIQMSLLPQGPLRMPGLSVTALCVPAREVGGDYYDFLPLDHQRLGVLIADVSGKGTSAALYMAELKGLVLSLSRIHRSPRELLIHANRIIAEHLDARSFITMTYAVLDLQQRTMTYARAGHTPLIYLPGPGSSSSRPRKVQILAPDGLVLGLKIDNGEMFERLLAEQTISLHGGDLYLFFTDGITEAMNEGDDCFGEGRLGRVIEDCAHLESGDLRERVLREVQDFVGTAPQHDDMTLILLKIDEMAAAASAERPAAIAEARA